MYCPHPQNENVLADGHKVVICFFDPTHEVREAGYKSHLLKCGARNQAKEGVDYFVCKHCSVHLYKTKADAILHEQRYCYYLTNAGNIEWSTTKRRIPGHKAKKPVVKRIDRGGCLTSSNDESDDSSSSGKGKRVKVSNKEKIKSQVIRRHFSSTSLTSRSSSFSSSTSSSFSGSSFSSKSSRRRGRRVNVTVRKEKTLDSSAIVGGRRVEISRKMKKESSSSDSSSSSSSLSCSEKEEKGTRDYHAGGGLITNRCAGKKPCNAAAGSHNDYIGHSIVETRAYLKGRVSSFLPKVYEKHRTTVDVSAQTPDYPT